MAEEKISPYSLNDLKNTTDDALGNYLRGLRFRQDNSKLDVRLALGYSAVIISAAIFVADYKLGWKATKDWTAVAVVAYGLLNGALTYWMWFVEKGLVFEGTREGTKISVTAKTKKHDPTYHLTVTTSGPGVLPTERQIHAPFTTWFTADGYFVAKPFQQWLASSVQTIGDVDVKNAGGARDEKDGDVTAAMIEDFEVVVPPAAGDGNATGADVHSKNTKKGKRKA